MQIAYIDTTEQLENFCQQINKAKWLALDTEFLREKTYFPKFCLLQIATLEQAVCIDPLKLQSLQPILDILYNPKIIKVFHSAWQDLEIFYHLVGKVPSPVFDTQVAAPLLGFQENIGYATLVSSLLGVNLSKTHTRTDWSLRPLSQDQLKYAVDDVIYLAEIYQKMTGQLKDQGRSDWMLDDFSQLVNADLYRSTPKDYWLKNKGWKKLTNNQLAVMQALTEWREQTAIAENRPRNWLLKNDLIINLAKLQPESISEINKIRNLHEHTIKRYGKTLCRLIKAAKNNIPIKAQNKPNKVKKLAHMESILDALTAVVKVRADENKINPAVLASRKSLQTLVLNRLDSFLLQGWRASMVGNELVAVLDGEKSIAVKGEKIVIS